MKRIFIVAVILVIFSGMISKEGADACHWAPNKGLADISQWAAINYFLWYNQPNWQEYSKRPTYEQETRIADKSFASYSWYNGYWVSTLPTNYFDVGNSCDAEDNFTVGSLDAELIKNNTWYYTSISLRPDIAGRSSTVKLFGQLGNHPWWCENAWCSAGQYWCNLAEFTAPARIWWQK